jgi:hypothetical protein
MFEKQRAQIMKSSPTSDGGTYQARFSTAPMDYSVWDCYKTGTANPAIACDLKQRPTQQETTDYQKAERDEQARDQLAQKASDYFFGLTPASLVQACGQGERKTYGYGDLYLSLNYEKFEFRFMSLGEGKSMIDSITENAPRFRLWKIGSSNEEALDIMQDLPCLAVKLVP